MKFFKANNFSLNLWEKTYIMGILNLTPDSFSDGGIWNSPNKAIERAITLEKLGADIIDIGAQSTRPGYTKISAAEEIKRLENILPKIRKEVNIPISIDTFYPEVAEFSLSVGVDILNDVTGFKNGDMIDIASKSKCGIICMHDGPGFNVTPFFKDRLNALLKKGIEKDRICFDPGIGFGKTYEENLYILKNLKSLKLDGYPILIGASRKRVIGAPCGNPPFNERMPGTIAAHTIAISGGADIIRVHDVKEAVQAAKVADAILR